MAEPSDANTHELFVWNAEELREAIKQTREGVQRASEANEYLKSHIDADIVALTQLMQASHRVATQIKLLGITGRAYIKEVRGKKYIIFKGDQRLRPNLRGTRYLAENAKVRCFVVGSKDIIEDALKGTKVAIIAFVAIDIAIEATSDQPSLASLGVRIGSDVLQAALSAGAGAAAGAFLATTVGAPVVITFIVVVVVGFAVGMALAELDRRYRLTDRARARMMAVEKELGRDFTVLKQEAITAGGRAVALGRRAGQDIAAEAYKVDRYFSSAAEMLKADGLDYFYGL